VGRRKSPNSSQGRAEGRVRARVQQRTRGGAKRGGGVSGRKRNTLDLSAIEGQVNRLADRSGSVSRLVGAASAFAGGSFAGRLLRPHGQQKKTHQYDYRWDEALVGYHRTVVNERSPRNGGYQSRPTRINTPERNEAAVCLHFSC